MYAGCYTGKQIKSKRVGSITGDYESSQNGISALTTHVNGVDCALGEGGDLHLPTAHANHPTDLVQNHPHLHSLFMQKSFLFIQFIK